MTTDRIVMIFAGSAVFIRSYLKIRIFVRDQGEAENQPAGILKYVEDLRRGFNADIERKNFFEMASSTLLSVVHTPHWLWITALVGINLLQSGFTGFCPLATILKKLGIKPGAAFG